VIGTLGSWAKDPLCKRFMDNHTHFQKFIFRDDVNGAVVGKWQHEHGTGVWIWSWPWAKAQNGCPQFSFDHSLQQWTDFLMAYLPADERWSFTDQKTFARCQGEIVTKWGQYDQIFKELKRRPEIVVDWASAKSNASEAEMHKGFNNMSTVGGRPWDMIIHCCNRLFDKAPLKKYITDEKYLKKVIIRDDAKDDNKRPTGKWEYDAAKGVLVWSWSWAKNIMNGCPNAMHPDVAEIEWPKILGS